MLTYLDSSLDYWALTIILMKGIILSLTHSFHVATLLYEQGKSNNVKSNNSDKNNEHFLFTSI